jgi:hypothetical protein
LDFRVFVRRSRLGGECGRRVWGAGYHMRVHRAGVVHFGSSLDGDVSRMLGGLKSFVRLKRVRNVVHSLSTRTHKRAPYRACIDLTA